MYLMLMVLMTMFEHVDPKREDVFDHYHHHYYPRLIVGYENVPVLDNIVFHEIDPNDDVDAVDDV